MSMNDPLGDMLTRIRNAQMRKSGNVSTPGSSLRHGARRVEGGRLHPRLLTTDTAMAARNSRSSS